VAPADRAVSNHVKLVVTGDVVVDPFGQYVTPSAPAVVLPADYLDPATARDEYTAHLTNAPWDMAAGTQRVVKTADALSSNDPNAWMDTYYGCSADGTTQPRFPTASADWSLLSVSAKLPSKVGVSYGWVIDNNPVVNLTVKNTSGHTLPGFWGQPSTSLYLVKDGKVVATSYLASTDPNGTAADVTNNGLLSPDASLGGTYLWRDASGCWTGNSQLALKPGTYTVLLEQDIAVDNGANGGIMYANEDSAKSAADGSGVVAPGAQSLRGKAPAAGDIAPSDGATSTNVTSVGGGAAILPAPTDGTYDWLSLQVWTSLGHVTLS